MPSDAVGESQLARDGSFLIVPTVRPDVDYADVPGLSSEAPSKLEAAHSHSGAGGPTGRLTSAAFDILAAYLRREARRRNSVATA